MKNLFRATLVCAVFVPFFAQAQIHDNHAKNKIAGEYLLKTPDAMLTDELHFEMNNRGQIVKAEYQSREFITQNGIVRTTQGMTKGLQVFHLVFGDGSDEEQQDIHVILSFDQDGTNEGHLTIKLVSVFEAIMENPNNASSITVFTNAQLLKKSKTSNQFEAITAAKE